MSKKKSNKKNEEVQDEQSNVEQSTMEAPQDQEKADAGAKIGDSAKEIQELKDKYLRLFAEFDNYKKRTIKEKLELMKTAGPGHYGSSSASFGRF